MFRFDPNDIDPVVRSVERRVGREAIRQIDSIDLDDDDDRVDPLPRFDRASLDTSDQDIGPSGCEDVHPR